VIPVAPDMQAVLSHADGETPVIDVVMPLGDGVYGKIETYEQWLGMNEPTLQTITVSPAYNINLGGLFGGVGAIDIPAQYSYVVSDDINMDAHRVSGQLTLGAGTTHAVAAAPTAYGQTVSSVYSVDVLHTWKDLSVLQQTGNAIANAVNDYVVKPVVNAWNSTVGAIIPAVKIG